jgi:uncharacterized protein (TIGR02145 family)
VALTVKFRPCIIVLIFIILSEFLYSQTDREFWFAAPDITNAITYPPQFDTINIDRPIILNVSTADGPATIHVSQPANPSFPVLTYTIQTDQYFQIDLTPYIDQVSSRPANIVLNKGLHITSDKPINCIYEIQNRINSESYCLKGQNALGTEFLIPAQNLYSNYPYCNPPARNSIAIVATEDFTTIKLKPTSLMEGQNGLDTIYFVLNRGQSWNGRALLADTSSHLGGSFVFSDKPIAITVTDDAVHPDNGAGLSVDIAGDQLIPREVTSTEYIILHFPYFTFYYLSMIYIYAFQDSTVVNLNGTYIGTINRGEVLQQLLTSDWEDYVQTTHPVEIYSFLRNSNNTSEVSGQIVPPLNCAGSRRVSIAKTGPHGMFDQFWVQILTQNGNQSNFTCSDPNIQSFLIPQYFGLIPSTGNQWGLYIFGGTLTDSTITFSNSTGNFQITTITCLLPGALRYSSFTSYTSLNLGPDRVLCPNDSIILDAGFGKDYYLWSTGDTTESITIKNAGIYWVSTLNDSCYLSDTVSVSNLIYTHINLGPDKTICGGDSTKLDAGPGKAWYHWNTGQTTESIYVHDTGTYWINVPVSPCNFTDSDTVHIYKISSIDLGPDISICQGDSIMLDAGPGMSSYLWNTGATTQRIEARDSGKYSIIVHYQNCGFSDSIHVSYLSKPYINLGSDTTICSGQLYTFDAGYCSGCYYQWDDLSANQMNVGNNQTFTTGQSGIYRAVITGSNRCKNMDTIQLSLLNALPVAISITASANNICQGIPVTFSASTQYGGASPFFLWRVNGVPVGTSDSIFVYQPVNGDTITCSIFSSEIACISNNPAISNKLIMMVMDNLEVSVTISVTANPVCAGIPVTFTAIPINSGSSPVYQWKVNGSIVGTNNPSYTYIPSNGDIVGCILSTIENCTYNNPALSNQINMAVLYNIPVSITISASTNPFCPGNAVIFTAIPVNGGADSSFQWKVNGVNTGPNSPIFTYTPVSGDQVTCVLSSSLNCTTGNPASSNTIVMSGTLAPVVTFIACFDTILTTNAQPVILKGGIPLGGSYTGVGVTNGKFYPSMAGPGTYLINYTYTNTFLCSASAHSYIHSFIPANFSCGNSLIDIRDSKSYPTIQIGSQCWLAANLNFGITIDGNVSQRDNCLNEKYCFDDNPVNCTIYGGLYQWDEMMQYENTPGKQGICPSGWHIPSENDWQVMFTEYNGAGFSGSPLIETGFSGFNALTNGSDFENSGWNFFGFATHLWSSTSCGNRKAWAHALNNIPDNHSVSKYPSLRSNAFAIRCLKN